MISSRKCIRVINPPLLYRFFYLTLKKIKKSQKSLVDDKFINFRIFENENEMNIFFDKKTYNLIGWQTLDIYQNLSITYLSSINKNNNLDENLFNLPTQN